MCRVLYVVARGRPDLYRRFSEELAGGADVEIILDRRREERRRGERRQGGGSGLPGRRSGRERRRTQGLEAGFPEAGFFTVLLGRGAPAP